jgi:hypothetical protein
MNNSIIAGVFALSLVFTPSTSFALRSGLWPLSSSRQPSGANNVYSDVPYQEINMAADGNGTMPWGTKYCTIRMGGGPLRSAYNAFNRNPGCYEIWTSRYNYDTDPRMWILTGQKNGVQQFASLSDDLGVGASWDIRQSRIRFWTEPTSTNPGVATFFVSVFSTAQNNDSFFLNVAYVGSDKTACNDGGPFVSAVGEVVTWMNTN